MERFFERLWAVILYYWGIGIIYILGGIVFGLEKLAVFGVGLLGGVVWPIVWGVLIILYTIIYIPLDTAQQGFFYAARNFCVNIVIAILCILRGAGVEYPLDLALYLVFIFGFLNQ